MANVTGTTADRFIDEVWSTELNRAITFDLVIANLFADWTSKMKGGGEGGRVAKREKGIQ